MIKNKDSNFTKNKKTSKETVLHCLDYKCLLWFGFGDFFLVKFLENCLKTIAFLAFAFKALTVPFLTLISLSTFVRK